MLKSYMYYSTTFAKNLLNIPESSLNPFPKQSHSHEATTDLFYIIIVSFYLF